MAGMALWEKILSFKFNTLKVLEIFPKSIFEEIWSTLSYLHYRMPHRSIEMGWRNEDDRNHCAHPAKSELVARKLGVFYCNRGEYQRVSVGC